MPDVLAEVVARRRDRAIAAILGLKEREVDQYLPPEVSKRLRKAVLDQLNDFAGLVTDVLEPLTAPGSAVILNDHWLVKLDEVHQAVVGNGSG